MVCLEARKDAGVAVAASHRAVIPHFATFAKAADERRQTTPRWRHVAFISLHAFYSEVSATDLFGCSVEHRGQPSKRTTRIQLERRCTALSRTLK